MKVKFVSSVPALCWDHEFGRLIKVVRAIDDQGREWESYDDGPYVLVELPDDQNAFGKP